MVSGSIVKMKNNGKHVNNERRGDVDSEKNKQKKPFQKKEYRLKKYSNKYKVEKWEERRKKVLLRQYYKDLPKNQRNELKLKSKSKDDNDNVSKSKFNAFEKAKQERSRRKEELAKQKEEALRRKTEKEEALKRYKEKKIETYKKLSKKTKKGQPVMKDRLEMLLEKIQQTT